MTVGSAAATHAYGEASYWDRRYSQDPGPFEWYQKYSALRPLLDPLLHRHHRILIVGCGNSALGEDMVNDGYQDVVNIDISSVVIEAMQKKYQEKPELKYMLMDVMDMSDFESGSFDAVIDKGTLDSLMCGQGAQQNSTKMLEEVGRVLKDKGIYILITYGDPSYRLYLLKELQLWNINLHVIVVLAYPDRSEGSSRERNRGLISHIPWNVDGTLATALLGSNPEVHYIYVCTKDESLRRHQNENLNSAASCSSPFQAVHPVQSTDI